MTTNQTIHFRIWRGRLADALCKAESATTSPNADKVNCDRCKARMLETAR